MGRGTIHRRRMGEGPAIASFGPILIEIRARQQPPGGEQHQAVGQRYGEIVDHRRLLSPIEARG